jgi:glycerophosphoryl diester phosphodiesterase
VDGISVDKAIALRTDAAGNTVGVTDIVERAHAAGLTIFVWTLRAENRFLSRNFRRGPKSAFGDWKDEFTILIDGGVDGVFTDQPDLVFEAIGRFED